MTLEKPWWRNGLFFVWNSMLALRIMLLDTGIAIFDLDMLIPIIRIVLLD